MITDESIYPNHFKNYHYRKMQAGTSALLRRIHMRRLCRSYQRLLL